MKKVRTLGTKRWVCAILAWALLLTPSLTLAAGAPEQTAAQPLTLESIPAELAQTLELDELSPLAELNDADEEQLNSLTISNGDGTSTAYIFQGPIKYLDNQTNSIKFIDNKLKASDKSSGFLEKYAYENTANDIKVYLPKKIKKGVDMEYENISINMRPEIINNEKGVLKEYAFAGEAMEVMEYPDAFGEGYHLQYQPINRGLKENILVEKYNGTNSFSFELKLKKGSAEISEDNRIIYIKDENGERVFILNQPYARDSYVGIDPELKHRTFDDYYILEQTGNKTYRVTMVIDAEFLASEDTVYPVLIDPTTTKSSRTITDMSLLSSGGTSYGPNSEFVSVGYFGSVYYLAYSKSNFVSSHQFIRPENVNSIYHRTYVTSLTGTGAITVYDSNKSHSITSSSIYAPTYSDVLNNTGSVVSSLNVTKQGWVDFNLTSLGVKWLKYLTGGSGGKMESCGYVFTSSGPGTIIMSSAEHATYAAYIRINFNEDESINNNLYYIRNKSTGKYLTQAASGTSISAATANNTTRQVWEITKTNGLYYIKNKGTGKYLGSPNGQAFALNGSPVASTSSQKWRIVRNGDGTYRLFESNSRYCLQNSSSLGSSVKAIGYSAVNDKKWEIVYAVDQVAVKWPNGTFLQKRNPNNASYKNETGVALEVGKSKQVTVVTLDGNIDLQAPYSISVSDTSKISATYSGRTITITGKAKGTTSIMIISGTQSVSLPVVVADKVLDVPHIRQEKRYWCWAACAQMMVEYYNPNTTATQTDMARTGQGLKENEEPVDKNGGYHEMKTIVETYTSETTIQKQETEFTESMLLSELNSGDPVIYLSTREKDGEWEGGHFNIIYGYYWDSSNNRNIYLTYDPWDTCARANSIHLDVWRRSWANIQHEMDTPATTDRAPDDDYNTDAYYYYANWFMYCQ